jgi:hypothetical protein
MAENFRDTLEIPKGTVIPEEAIYVKGLTIWKNANNDADTFDIDNKPIGMEYDGYAIKNVPNGYGRITYDNGKVMEGNFEDGKKNGKFRIEYDTGYGYRGKSFKNYKNGIRITNGGGKRTKKSKKLLRKKRKTIKKRRG